MNWMASQPAGPTGSSCLTDGIARQRSADCPGPLILIQAGSIPFPRCPFIGVGEAGYQVFIADESPFMGADQHIVQAERIGREHRTVRPGRRAP